VTEFLEKPWTSAETSDDGPALVALGDRLYIAWVGSGNDHLNVMPSVDLDKGVVGFDSAEKVTIDRFGADEVGSLGGPALAANPDGHLILGWTHNGGGLFGQGGAESMFAIIFDQWLTRRGDYVSLDTSDDGPAMTFWAGGNGLNTAWRGSGNENLNVMHDMNTFTKFISPETSPHRPALCTGRFPSFTIYIAWAGVDNRELNVMSCDNTHPFVGEQPDPTAFDSSSKKIYAGATSPSAPAIETLGKGLYLVWQGDNDHLYLIADSLSVYGTDDPRASEQRTKHHPAIAAFRDKLFVAWTGTDDHLNVAQLEPQFDTRLPA
jgi:hypothetical protein